MKTNENQRKSMEINENQWKLMKINEILLSFINFGALRGRVGELRAPRQVKIPYTDKGVLQQIPRELRK